MFNGIKNNAPFLEKQIKNCKPEKGSEKVGRKGLLATIL